MAIDDETRRMSMVAFGRMRIPAIVVPDGSIDEGDRRTFLRVYSGITGAVAAVTGRHRVAERL